ncbi:cell division protein FtsQ [Isorropodon fossajaponicum endosymbiont JTNG4]|uniref:cell division protein FtsQ/DivIB n=1 Tax=Isorropodon fossajaponicum symbiont TaxID=883811 RepID=UPI001914E6A4|nr:FtsQ-type POTRA domain-containing protein [Isorropodon fossajaponicum symbiont]BBB23524.1 cell division protein FtsQ [Isorropodon fossajaponicum endosymbiont JTNG4]
MKYKRRNRRKKSIYQPIFKLLSIIILLGLITCGVQNTHLSKFLKVDINWEIDKNLPITQQVLKRRIFPLITETYQLNLHEIKHELERHPWVANAKVSRLFWNFINIKISAQQISMRWKNKDCPNDAKTQTCQGYISTKGELFTPNKIIKSNAIIATSAHDKDIVKTLFDDYQTYQAIIKPMVITSIFKTNIDTLFIKPNIKVILGYQKQKKRLKNFVKVYKKLRQSIARAKLNRATFDMRYAKGFSLKF